MFMLVQLITTHNAMLTLIRNVVQIHHQHFIEVVTVLEVMEGQTQEPMLAPPCQLIFNLDDANGWKGFQ